MCIFNVGCCGCSVVVVLKWFDVLIVDVLYGLIKILVLLGYNVCFEWRICMCNYFLGGNCSFENSGYWESWESFILWE